jgi:diguanylate cyclase (GGDEF)-like protein
MVFWALVPALLFSLYLLSQINKQAVDQGKARLESENKQLTVELERTLFQIQNQLIRLSEQGAVKKSATVSFLSQKAIEQMEGFKAQFPMVDSIVLLDTEQFPMEVLPEAVLKVDFSSLENFVNNLLVQKYKLTLESVTPQIKYFYSAKLAEISHRADQHDYLAIGQPIVRLTDSLTKPYLTDGALIVTINIDAFMKQLTANVNIDMTTTNISLEGANYTLYRTDLDLASPLEKTTQLLEYSQSDTNPDFHLEMVRSWETLKKNVDATVQTFVLLLGLFMAIILFLAIFVSRALTRPLRQLQQATRTLTAGNYDRIDSFSNFKEFQELADLLTVMGQTIQLQFKQLNSSKFDLEQKVNERTIELQASIQKLKLHGNLLRSLMQVSVDMQRSRSIDNLLEASFIELETQFKLHRCGIVLNRYSSRKEIDRLANFTDEEESYLSKYLPQWRNQDFDFRIDQFNQSNWILIPIRDAKRQVVGQIILLGPLLSDIERDILFILTRLLSTMLDQLALTLKLERLANTDALTGLANRHFFENQFADLKNRTKESQSHQGLLVIDVDGLKLVNDKYGHEYGDLMIQTVAEHLKKICRESDILARMGGDEFYILLTETNNRSCELATNRLQEVADHLYIKVKEGAGVVRVPISFSIGFSCSETDPLDSLIKLADQRMYTSKRIRKSASASAHV